MTDRPTFTTEPSMNARLEARMDVLRTRPGYFVLPRGAMALAAAAAASHWARTAKFKQELSQNRQARWVSTNTASTRRRARPVPSWGVFTDAGTTEDAMPADTETRDHLSPKIFASIT